MPEQEIEVLIELMEKVSLIRGVNCTKEKVVEAAEVLHSQQVMDELTQLLWNVNRPKRKKRRK